MSSKPEKSTARLSPEKVQTQLRLAREAFERSGFLVGSPRHTSVDFQELGLFSADEHSAALQAALDEVKAEDYCGPHPPDHISREPKCKGIRMVQFSWPSAHFKRKMYVKFCVSGRRLALLRLHPDYQPNRFNG